MDDLFDIVHKEVLNRIKIKDKVFLKFVEKRGGWESINSGIGENDILNVISYLNNSLADHDTISTHIIKICQYCSSLTNT